MESKIKETLITEEALQARVKALGAELTERFKDSHPLVIAVLNGSFMFCADLMKNMTFPLEIQFVKASSYKNESVSDGNVSVTGFDLDVKDRDLIVIEDIVDSGNTLSKLTRYFDELGAKSVTTVVLLDKPSRRTVAFEPEYTGFVIDDKFVVGYGLDYAQFGRNLPYIGVVDLSKVDNL